MAEFSVMTSVVAEYHGLKKPVQSVNPSTILEAGIDRIPLEDAAGRTSRGMITPYPPGLALVCPGEIISRDIVDYIATLVRSGGSVHGIGEDGTVAVLHRK